jgi:hypothetical protein
MDNNDFSEVNWLDPWYWENSGLERELTSEVSAQHLLFQVEATAVARRSDNDDVLLFLPKSTLPLAVVHLTWRKEMVAEWPVTRFYSSLADFIEHCMKPDHREYLTGNRGT